MKIRILSEIPCRLWFTSVDWFAASSVELGNLSLGHRRGRLGLLLGVCRVAVGSRCSQCGPPDRARLMGSHSGRQIQLNMRRALGGGECPVI